MIRHWLAMLSVVAWASGAWAETPAEWPSRAVRAIVPISAGSGIDIVAQQLAKQLGRPFVVENRPGGATTTGTVHQRRSRRPCAAPSFRQSPADKPWGRREMAIATPDGHGMMSGQKL
jgi:tripartite-type tricarboxylate transporter receptor subunit TctC